MRLLLVNTATTDRFTALAVDGCLQALEGMTDERRQVQDLVPALQRIAGDFSALDGFGVVTGPGSFTGVRIGIAALRGMALALEKPLIGMTAFDMYARALGPVDGDILAAVDSRRDELYYQVFTKDLQKEGDAFMLLPETLPARSGIVVTGDGAPLSAVAGEVRVSDAEDCALALAHFAAKNIEKNLFSEALPYYVRPPDITLPGQR